jgi:phytoene synthase
MAMSANAPSATGGLSGAEALPAAGSKFYTAMRILPHDQREAMYAIYAFCRAVDDIADEEAPSAARRAALQQWRRDIDRLFQGQVSAGTSALAAPVARFRLRREDFHAVIDGMAMDAEADPRSRLADARSLLRPRRERRRPPLGAHLRAR